MSLLLALTGGSSPTNYQIDAQAGTYALTGQVLTVSRNRVATVLNCTYTLTGQAAIVSRNRVATVQNGSYTLTGQSATVSRNRVATPSNGVYALSGQVITVTYTPAAVNYQIDAQAGSYAVTGQAITVDIAEASAGGGAGSNKKKHRRIHPREIWEEDETEEVAEKAEIVAKKLQVRGSYADIPLPDLEYAIAQLEKIVGADYDEDDVEVLLLLI